MYLFTVAVVAFKNISFGIVIALSGKDHSFGSFALSVDGSGSPRTLFLDVLTDDDVSGFSEVLKVIFGAETFVENEEIHTYTSSVRDLSEVGVEVGELVVGEGGLKRTGDDDGRRGKGEGHQKDSHSSQNH